MSGHLDVVIAGAGPAGAVAALVLARAGARVLMVERARFPRHKLCGDTVNPGALAVLRRLGVSDCVERRGLRLSGMIVSGLGGVRVRGAYAPPDATTCGRAMTRRELDMALVEAAVAAGARFDDGMTVRAPLMSDHPDGSRVAGLELAAGAGRLRRPAARVTIAADGRRSVLASTLGLTRQPNVPPRWVVGGYFQGVEGLSAYGEMHVRRDYFIGVAPLPDGLANVCVVSPERRRYARPARFLETVLQTDRALRDRFGTARLTGPVTSMGPLAVDVSAAGWAGLLLAGDAAGFIDPITGDGLRFAFRGGELAARAALDMLASGRVDGHRRLAEWRDAEFGPKWRFNRAVRALVGSPLGVRAGSLGAAAVPAVLRRVIRYAGDTRVDQVPA